MNYLHSINRDSEVITLYKMKILSIKILIQGYHYLLHNHMSIIIYSELRFLKPDSAKHFKNNLQTSKILQQLS